MKDKIIKLIGYNNYKSIIVTIFRNLNKFHLKNWYNDDLKIIEKQEIKEENRNCYFGYYDNSSVSNGNVLYLSSTYDINTKANVCIYNLKNQQKKILAATKSWNMQMGSRLRWYNNNIIYNDFENGQYISKIIDINGKLKSKLSFPIYDISYDLKFSYYCNFSILNVMRPGYGYNNILLEKNDINNIENGIFQGNFETNKGKLILSMNDIINYKKVNNCFNSYINHICCSKYDDKIMFFHLWEDQNKQMKNRVFIIDSKGKILNILDDFDRASHYSWKNYVEILFTIIINNKCEYRLYNIIDGTYKVLDFLTVDGHPSYVSEYEFITDTYPDHNGMEHLLLCNENGIIAEIGEFFHNSKKNNEYRCDLHPRYFDGYLSFDCLNKKYRTQRILKVNFKDPIYSYKRADNNFYRKLYMSLCHKIDVNPLKYIYFSLTNFSYKAHKLFYKMMNSKCKFITNIYFNKLQKKFSIWISPECKIGENIHFMHLDGITIGSGVIIGSNCTIYQQVTIGKEKGKFPKIGNNVTIFSGAKIIGDVTIGDNCIIGANAVVVKDVPANSIAIGVPAKNKSREKNHE